LDFEGNYYRKWVISLIVVSFHLLPITDARLSGICDHQSQEASEVGVRIDTGEQPARDVTDPMSRERYSGGVLSSIVAAAAADVIQFYVFVSCP
jgi:hypothetical protein